MKKSKLLVRVGLACLLLFVAGKIISGNMDQTATPTPPEASPTSLPEANPSPTVPDNTTTPGPPNNDGTRQGQQAALAAATAVGLLSTASFLREAQVDQLVDELVAPEVQEQVAASIHESGDFLADYMGYGSVDEASLLSRFAERAVLYRVQEVNKTQAKVWLLVETSWVQANGQNYRMPTINLVTLRWEGDRWLYVSTETSPEGSQPDPQPGLSWEQTMTQFSPYLKGFDDVSNIVPGGSA